VGSESGWTADPSVKIFLSTLTDAHNVHPQRFPLASEIHGPMFHDLGVDERGNEIPDRWICMQGAYTNNTGLDTELTGSTPYTDLFDFDVLYVLPSGGHYIPKETSAHSTRLQENLPGDRAPRLSNPKSALNVK
jgi:hypothetical protein